MVKKLNPILLSAIIVAIFVYSKIVPIQTDYIKNAIVASDKINKVEGTIASNPTKISEKYYIARLKLKNVESFEENNVSENGSAKVGENNFSVKSNATGVIPLLIPAEIVEAFYPEKLFSKNKKNFEKNNSFPIEQGVHFCAFVNSLISNSPNSEKNTNSDKSKNFFNSKKSSKSKKSPIFIVKSVEKIYFTNSIFDKIQKNRALFRLQFKRLMSYWGKAGGLFLALISSSKEYLDASMQQNFQLSGLSHILALSGMHLALISSILGIANNFTRLKKVYLIFQLCGIIIFVWFAGASPSLLRALIMFALIAFCKIFDVKTKNGINILAVTFLLHAAISPSDLENLGFMFSYGALLGIYLVEPFIKPIFIKFLPVKISESISASCSANFLTAPISLKYFGFYSPSGIICTLFVSPLITIFLYSGIAFMLINFCFPITCGFSKIVITFIYEIISRIVEVFKFIPVIKI